MSAYLGLHGTGAGQTVAVVDAPGNPNLVADVDHFSSQFGLSQVCADGTTTGCFHLTVTAPNGTGADDPNWAIETSMDVEWIHAVAPQAAVELVEARDGDFASLFQAVDAAATLRPDAISMSWGLPEEFTDETYYDHHCQLADSLCVVSSGDYGFPGSYPAYNPAVLAVGGTTLKLSGDGTVTGETAWSGSGGGRSYVEPTPAYQHGVVTGGRGIPDVSYDADPNTGVAVYDSSPVNGQSGWFQVGGTSLGAPSWAAILASTDQLRTAAGAPQLTDTGSASAQQTIYDSAGQLGDIVAGPANGSCPDICSAGTGYDFVTGLGSPRTGLDAALAAAH
jgi:subtilase family serine protease